MSTTSTADGPSSEEMWTARMGRTVVTKRLSYPAVHASRHPRGRAQDRNVPRAEVLPRQTQDHPRARHRADQSYRWRPPGGLGPVPPRTPRSPAEPARGGGGEGTVGDPVLAREHAGPALPARP